jgi:RNA recognition motif-containing protein
MFQRDKKTIYIGSLPAEYVDTDLRALFQNDSEITKVKVIFDAFTGKSLGYAYVEFASPKTALDIIKKLDGAEINGRRIRLSLF